MRYQITKALPYFIQRWVFFNKSATLEPLYKFDTTSDQSRIDEMMVNDAARTERKRVAAEGSGSDIQTENIEDSGNGHGASNGEKINY